MYTNRLAELVELSKQQDNIVSYLSKEAEANDYLAELNKSAFRMPLPPLGKWVAKSLAKRGKTALNSVTAKKVLTLSLLLGIPSYAIMNSPSTRTALSNFFATDDGIDKSDLSISDVEMARANGLL